MRDISHKSNTLRTAHAVCSLIIKPATLSLIQQNKTLKTDILPTARAAAFLAVKNTSQVIPHCHPLPVDHVQVDFTFGKGKLEISVKVKTIYKTGVEMEALYGASVAALTVYDMLKPQDKEISISETKLMEKRGGKTDFRKDLFRVFKAAVIVASDSVSSGLNKDITGKEVCRLLENSGIKIADYQIVADEVKQISNITNKMVKAAYDIVIVAGGTGISPRDNTPEAIGPLLDRELQGVMEAARAYGQQRTPYAMFSRSMAGIKDNTLILAIPGSPKGACETIEALFPAILHVFKVIDKQFKH